MDSLEKNNFTNSAQTLRERIAQCEAADVLCMKDLTKMKKDKLDQLLKATQSSWKHFNLHMKVKVLKHDVFHQLETTPPTECFNVLMNTIRFRGIDFDFEEKPFNIAEPTFTGLMVDFFTEVHKVMKTANQLPDSDDPEDLKMGMDDALESEKESVVDASLKQELAQLQKRAEETST